MSIPAGGAVAVSATAEAAMPADVPATNADTSAAPAKARPTVLYGSRGSAVKELQSKLSVNADGIFGLRTLTAVKAFQRSHGLYADGIVGPKTWAALTDAATPNAQTPASNPKPAAPTQPKESTPAPSKATADDAPAVQRTVFYGSRGAEVKIVQAKLNVTTTGYFGPLTLSAVKSFQRSHGLYADGVVGAKTWAALSGVATPAKPVVTKPATPATPAKPVVTTPAKPATPAKPVVTKPAETKPAPAPTPAPEVKITPNASIACGNAAATTLRYGMSGSLVKVLQGRLGIAPDGFFGPLTKKMVQTFQNQNGLADTGVVGLNTWAKLGCSVPAAQTPAPTAPSSSAPTAPAAPATPAPAKPSPAAGSGVTASMVLAEAYKYIGTPYIWGGSTPTGFDCSGFTSYVYKMLGISMPRTAAQQQAYFPRTTNPQPGDLVFYGSPAYHVGIYVGNGKMIDSAHPGTTISVRNIYGSPSSYGQVLR